MTDFPSVDAEADLAEAALAAGDHATALHHVAGALSADPLRPRFLAICDRLFDASDDAVALTAPSDRPWFGNVALHARALARDGRHTEAVHLLLQVIATRPDVPFVAWAVEWLDAPAVAVDPEALVPAVGFALQRIPPEHPALASLVPLLDRLCRSYDEPLLAGYRAALLCQVGDPRGPEAAAAVLRRESSGGLRG